MAIGNEKIITNYIYNGLNNFGMIHSNEIISIIVKVEGVDAEYTITQNKRIILNNEPNIGDKIKIVIEYVYNSNDLFITPEELLTYIKQVDGVDSGLDADLLQGINGNQYLKINDDIVVNSITTEKLKLPENITSFKIYNTNEEIILSIDENGLLILKDINVDNIITNNINSKDDSLNINYKNTGSINFLKDDIINFTIDNNGNINSKNIYNFNDNTYDIGSDTKTFKNIFINFIKNINDIIFDIPSLKSFIFKIDNNEITRINENGITTDTINTNDIINENGITTDIINTNDIINENSITTDNITTQDINATDIETNNINTDEISTDIIYLKGENIVDKIESNITYYNVLKSGLIGDGVFDNTNLLQNAFDLNIPLYFPNGTYIIKGDLTNWPKIIVGDNATLLFDRNKINTDTIYLDTVSNITFKGKEITQYSITDIDISGDVKDYSLTLNNLTQNSGLTVGDYVSLRETGNVLNNKKVEGYWKVITVNSDSLVIKNTSFGEITETSLSGDWIITHIPTIFILPDDRDGFVIKNGNPTFENIGVVGSYNVSDNTGTEGSNGFLFGSIPELTQGNSSNSPSTGGIYPAFGSFIAVNGFGEQGIVIAGGSLIANFTLSSANRKRGFYSAENSSIRSKFAISSGNGEDGFISDYNSVIWNSLSTSSGNGLSGLFTINKGVIISNNSFLINNKYRGVQSKRGYIDCQLSKIDLNPVGIEATNIGEVFGKGAIITNSNDKAIVSSNNSFVNIENGTIDTSNIGIRKTGNSEVLDTNINFGTNTNNYSNASLILRENIYSNGIHSNGDTNIVFYNSFLPKNNQVYNIGNNSLNFKGGYFKTLTTTGLYNTGSTGIRTNYLRPYSGNNTYVYANYLPTDLTYNLGNSTKRFKEIWGDKIKSNEISSSGNTNIVFKNNIFTHTIKPITDDTYDLGSSDYRFKDIYASSGYIQTSDRKLKKDIELLNDELVISIIEKLKPSKFRMINGERIHYGFIAQDIEEIHNILGIDIAWLIKTPKTKKVIVTEKYKYNEIKTKTIQKEKEIINEDGTSSIVKYDEEIEYEVEVEKEREIEKEEIVPNEYIYGLRYEEFISLIVRYNQILKNKLNNLEERIYNLENK